MDSLSKISIDQLPNTSALTIRRLKLIGIKNFWDLINYFPFRYENYSLITKISTIQEGEVVTLKGLIIDFQNQYTKKGKNIQKAVLYDQSGKIDLVWYNQPYLLRIIKSGSHLSVSGQIKKFGYSLVMEVQEYDLIKNSQDNKTIHTGRIIPIYPEKKGLSSRILREKIWHLLNNNYHYQIEEILPQEIINFNQLISEKEAYFNIHFPLNSEQAKKSKKRLAFDEIFTINLSSQLIRREWRKEKVSCQLVLNHKNKILFDQFINNLPFKLTPSQNKVLFEIIQDLKKNYPMNRLLQGDVGSGKTVIAAAASYLSFINSFKTLIMAPTEILAQQHFHTFQSIFKKSNLIRCPKIILYTSSNKPKPNDLTQADIVIGTHALIQKNISFNQVALVIIDEQHKFGVIQRAMLKNKAQHSHLANFNPHLLTMTATPIPRTVALTLYGELDLSTIDELPPGRIAVKTFIIPPEKRGDAYHWIKSQIKNFKTQVFIVCPLIEESAVETLQSVKAVKKEFETIKKIFFEFKVDLLHGKIKNSEKEMVMKKFANAQTDILVTTPVVEVGVDVPNANIIIIEAAERFGLAQLHQLRGRVGRGNKQAYCFLFTSNEKSQLSDRLHFFSQTNSGFKLAEYDLKLRGPGEIYGTKQHGIINLKIANLSDFQLINKVYNAVNYFLNRYSLEKFLPLKKRIENYRIKIISQD